MHTTFSSGLGDSHFERPTLPADLLVAAGQPGLAAPLLEELDGDLAASAAVGGSVVADAGGAFSVELALESRGALVNHGFELVVVDVWEREV